MSGETQDMTFNSDNLAAITRRHFFRECGAGLGTMALASLFNERLLAGAVDPPGSVQVAKPPHFSPQVKNIIYLFMAGAPSQQAWSCRDRGFRATASPLNRR